MSSGADLTDDDDWGDFVNSGGLSHTISLPKPSEDLFGSNPDLNRNGSGPTQLDSVPVRASSGGAAAWEKPKGALPLSIFGYLEEEQVGSGAGDPSFGAILFTGTKKVDVVKESRSNVSDLIANLYKRSEDDIGSRSDLSSVEKVNGVEANFDLSNLSADAIVLVDSNWNSGNLGKNGLDVNGMNGSMGVLQGLNVDWNALNSNMSGLNLSNNGSDLVKKEQIFGTNGSALSMVDGNGGFGGDDEDDEEDGWEFKGADSDSVLRDKNDKDHWRSPQNSSGYTFRFGEDANIHVDLFGASHGTQKSGEQDARSNSYPSPLTEDNTISYTYSRNEQMDTDNGFHYLVDEKFDDDENSWAFKDAFSETEPKDKEEPKGAEVPHVMEAFAFLGETEVNKVQSDNHKGALLLSIFGDEENKVDDHMITQDISNQIPTSLTKHGIRSHSNIPINDLISSLYGQPEQDNCSNHGRNPSENGPVSTETSMAPNLASSANEFDDNSWEFKDASSDAFGTVESSDLNIPINDLLSSLYSPAEQNTSFNHAQNHNGNGSGFIEIAAASDLADAGDGFDDKSWEFKDAFSEANAEDDFDDKTWEFKDAFSEANAEDDFDDKTWQCKDASSGSRATDKTYLPELGEVHKKCSTKMESNDYVDFFLKLKEELHIVTSYHLQNLKKAQSAAALTGEDAKVEALDKEIQDLGNELQQDGVISDNHLLRSICLNEFVEVLREPKFQAFELEYQLLKKLTLVENNWRSAVELFKYVTLIVKILILISTEEQLRYVSTWLKILNICIQELQHGALIWKQSLHKNVHDQILSKPQGKKYILALGEIYRVVEVLGSSIKLYKPWVLANAADPAEIFSLLSECSTLWSSSGLKEALQSISDLTGFQYDGSPEILLQSIEEIHYPDAFALYKHVFSGQETICKLSLLTPETAPGMRTVTWNCECYFLTLANLWANLVSCDPPNLPRINVGE